jgi:hypothetical protein
MSDNYVFNSHTTRLLVLTLYTPSSLRQSLREFSNPPFVRPRQALARGGVIYRNALVLPVIEKRVKQCRHTLHVRREVTPTRTFLNIDIKPSSENKVKINLLSFFNTKNRCKSAGFYICPASEKYPTTKV